MDPTSPPGISEIEAPEDLLYLSTVSSQRYSDAFSPPGILDIEAPEALYTSEAEISSKSEDASGIPVADTSIDASLWFSPPGKVFNVTYTVEKEAVSKDSSAAVPAVALQNALKKSGPPTVVSESQDLEKIQSEPDKTRIPSLMRL